MADTVAVIIPAYNAANFIERAIRSALQQSETAEVIVVDDVSTDETCAVVQALATGDPRVELLRRTENGGPSAARNDAIDAASSDWIAILDADDAYVPGRLAPLLQLAREQSADMVADNLVYFDVKADEPLGPVMAPAIGVQHITLDHVFRSTPDSGRDYVTLKPMFRREFLLDHSLKYDETIRNGEDFDLAVRCLLAGARYAGDFSQTGYLYSTRESGTSRTTISDQTNIEQTTRWLGNPAFLHDPRRLTLVHDRLAILRRRQLDRISGNSTFAQRFAIARMAVNSKAGRRWLIENIGRRFRSSAR